MLVATLAAAAALVVAGVAGTTAVATSSMQVSQYVIKTTQQAA